MVAMKPPEGMASLRGQNIRFKVRSIGCPIDQMIGMCRPLMR